MGTGSHCQALAEAILNCAWQQEADLDDDASVRRVLGRYIRKGNEPIFEHRFRGKRLVALLDGCAATGRAHTPEEIALARLVSWPQQFDSPPIRFATDRLSEQDQAVARAWASRPMLPWTQAPLLVGQDRSRGERTRRLLKASGREWIRRQNNRREGA